MHVNAVEAQSEPQTPVQLLGLTLADFGNSFTGTVKRYLYALLSIGDNFLVSGGPKIRDVYLIKCIQVLIIFDVTGDCVLQVSENDHVHQYDCLPNPILKSVEFRDSTSAFTSLPASGPDLLE